jgi:5'-3' exonuclease
MDFFS